MGRNTGRTTRHQRKGHRASADGVAAALAAAEVSYAALAPAKKSTTYEPMLVRWWWDRYAAPIEVVVRRHLDGREETRGELLRCNDTWNAVVQDPPMLRRPGDALAVTRTDRRRRHGPVEVAAAILWYYQNAAGSTLETIAESEDLSSRAVADRVRWLKAQLAAIQTTALLKLEP